MKVIARKHMPVKLPIGFTALGWLFFDRLDIPLWGWGVWWTLAGLLWVLAVVGLVYETETAPKWEGQ